MLTISKVMLRIIEAETANIQPGGVRRARGIGELYAALAGTHTSHGELFITVEIAGNQIDLIRKKPR